MPPILHDMCSTLARKLTAALMCALYGAPGFAQAQFILFDGPGAGQVIPANAPLQGAEVACPAIHYHSHLPFPTGPTLPGPHCGWGKVGIFSGGSIINVNMPSGSMIGGGDQILEFAGEVGGPVIKDRMWFWGSGNRNRIEQIANGIDIRSEGARLDSESRSKFKVAENDSPKPQDRFFFSYNFFEPVSGLGSSLMTPGAPGTDLKRETVGFERTFLDGPNSIGMRLPFVQIQGQQVIMDGFSPATDPGKPIETFPLIAGNRTTLTTFEDDDPNVGASARQFPAFVLIDIPGSNPLALGIPIDAPPPREFVQPPVEDLDAKARAELQKEVQRMSPEDRQKALDNPFASAELKQAVVERWAQDFARSIPQSDANLASPTLRGDR